MSDLSGCGLNTKTRRDEALRYLELFEEAFDELHSAVIRRVREASQYISPHHDYPTVSNLDSGFPIFHESGFHRDGSPRNYVGTIVARGLLGLLSGVSRSEKGLSKVAELAAFLRAHKIGNRLRLDARVYNGVASDRSVEILVGDAVERYLHMYGLDAPINSARRKAVVKPLLLGTVFRVLPLRLVVPITLTHFEVDRFRISETAYIVRIPKKLQLARARVSTLGSGAVQMVVGAATHAFVSNGWSLEVDSVDDVPKSLSQSSSNVMDAADTFFGALRIAAGIDTGYAQTLWVPKGWAIEYFCDLTPVYGTAIRRYPSRYDNYGWAHGGPTVTSEQLLEVRKVYGALVGSQEEAIRLAVSRLSGCLTRTDAADAVIDGTIGLELLLGDDQNQSLSYKLRLRAAALARLPNRSFSDPVEVASKVKRLYAARSAIVHGRRQGRSKKAIDPIESKNDDARLLASALLRFVLDVLLMHPEYLDPSKIDEELLLSGGARFTARRASKLKGQVSGKG